MEAKINLVASSKELRQALWRSLRSWVKDGQLLYYTADAPKTY